MEKLSKALSGTVLLSQDQTSRNYTQNRLPLSWSSCRSHSSGHCPSSQPPSTPHGSPALLLLLLCPLDNLAKSKAKH